MGYRDGDATFEFEGRIEVQTAKAYLVFPTMGPEQCWVPKSQTVSMSEPDFDGNRTFVVTKWWADKQEGF